jgi:hypothetical protein
MQLVPIFLFDSFAPNNKIYILVTPNKLYPLIEKLILRTPNTVNKVN